MGHTRKATVHDANALARHLREADLQEIKAVVGEMPPAIATSLSVLHSDYAQAMVGDDGETVIGLFGVKTTEPNVGAIWMLASHQIETPSHAKQFLRQCRAGVAKLNEQWPLLYNFVDARNELHMKWLSWCGFTFINRYENYGVESRPFFEFVRIPQCASH